MTRRLARFAALVAVCTTALSASAALPRGLGLFRAAQTEARAGEWNGLKFTAEQAGSVVKMAASRSAPSVSLLYSLDNGRRWYTFTVGTTEVTLANVGDTVCFKAGPGGNVSMGTFDGKNYFVMAGKIAASGNVNSLLDGTNFDGITSLEGRDYCYARLFYNCASLTSAPELPATELAERCYDEMFESCNSLTVAPELPAIRLETGCYSYMFQSCDSLTVATKIRFTNISFQSCFRMFAYCRSLREISIAYEGSFNSQGTYIFTAWVDGVSPTGTFHYSGTDTTRGISAIPTGWTVVPYTPNGGGQ